jgi:SAM-dependent methyltransferase
MTSSYAGFRRCLIQRPAHLNEENASRFGAVGVAEAYPFRLPYSSDVLDIIERLVTDNPRAVLDLGTGTGDVARPLASRVDRVDAVDISAAMIERGRRLPGGDAPNLTWIHAPAEDAPLSPPYALVTAGESLHWMDWDVLLPRLAGALTPHGNLAVVYRNELPPPWQDKLMELIREFSTMRDYQDYDLIEVLVSRGLFQPAGTKTARTESVSQPVGDYVRSFHSRASLAAEAIGEERALEFDRRLEALLEPWRADGKVRLQWAPVVTWGRPLGGFAAGDQADEE